MAKNRNQDLSEANMRGRKSRSKEQASERGHVYRQPISHPLGGLSSIFLTSLVPLIASVLLSYCLSLAGVLSMNFSLTLFPFVLVGCCFIGLLVAQHYAEAAIATSLVSAERAACLRAQFDQRYGFKGLHSLATLFIVFFAAIGWSRIYFASAHGNGGLSRLDAPVYLCLILVVGLLVAAFILIAVRGVSAFRLLSLALADFLHAGQDNRFQWIRWSSQGKSSQRVSIYVICLVAITMTLLPLAHFFPVLMVQGLTDTRTARVWGSIGPDDRDLRAPSNLDLRQHRSPVAWMQLAAFADTKLKARLVMKSLALGAACSFLAPPTILLSLVAISAGEPIAWIEQELGDRAVQQLEPDHQTHQALVAQMQASRDRIARKTIVCGYSEQNGDVVPYFFTTDDLARHFLVLGTTGGAKTSAVITPTVEQLIQMSGRDKAKHCHDSQRASIIVIDPKLDSYLCNTVFDTAADAGLPFTWYTNVSGIPTRGFNFFRQPFLTRLSHNQRVETLVNLLASAYGWDYGKAYFSAFNWKVLRRIMQLGDVDSWEKLFWYFSEGKSFTGSDTADLKNAQHPAALAELLAGIPSLNVTSENAPPEVVSGCIDVRSLLTTPQALVIAFKSANETQVGHIVARAFLYSLLSAASTVEEAQRIPVYIVCDEFSRILDKNLTLFFEQSRSARCPIIAGAQSVGMYDDHEGDLETVLDETANIQFYMSGNSLRQREKIIELSGKQLSWRPGISSDGGVNYSLIEEPRIGANDVIEMSAQQLGGVMRVCQPQHYQDFHGYSHVVNLTYCNDFGIYQERLKRPFPSAQPGMMTTEPSPWGPSADAVEHGHLKSLRGELPEEADTETDVPDDPEWEQQTIDFMRRKRESYGQGFSKDQET